MADSFRFKLAKVRDQLFPRPKLCSKKARYATRGEANGMRNHRQKVSGETLYVYQCQVPECHGFHLTRMKPPEEAMC